MKSWYNISAKEDSAEISIFGDIGASWWGESVTLADFKKDFDKIKDKNSIKVLINSPGGNVFDGIGIYNVISAVRQRVSVEVLGIAASIASVIALAGNDLVIGEGSFYMIHKPYAVAMGNAEEIRKTADVLDKVEEQMVAIYSQHTAMTEEELNAALEAETWYTADEAVEAGFASGTVDYGQLAASYDISRYQYAHVPAGIVEDEKPREAPTTIREFETRVRDMGFSKRMSETIASHGFAHRDDAEPEEELVEEQSEPAEEDITSTLIRARLVLLKSRKHLHRSIS